MSQDDKISNTGKVFEKYNGIPDWVFEEEVFEDNKAIWWSPNATKLVWGSFDDSDVKTYFLQEYGNWKNPLRQYPDLDEVHYPKVGQKNPKNSLWMTDLTNETMAKKLIKPPHSLSQEGEVHFSQVTWVDEGQKFAVTWFNRVQNKSVVTLCKVSDDLDCSANDIFKRVSSSTYHRSERKNLRNRKPRDVNFMVTR